MRYQGRFCVPNVNDLRNRILQEAHGSHYSIHPGSTNMYHDLRKVFLWDILKRDTADFVAKFPNHQQVKAEHLKLGGLLQEIEVPTWKREDINMYFVVGLPWTQKQHDSIWVVVDRLIISVHFIFIKSTNLVKRLCKNLHRLDYVSPWYSPRHHIE